VILFSTLSANENALNSNLNISGYLDNFYTYDFNNPKGNQRQNFLFNHNRHNEFNINLALIKLNYETERYKVNFAYQTGTYAVDNYAAEPRLLQNINEANIALSLDKNNNLWLETGLFASHLGFESAISSDNWTLTRSLCAENSPYFLTGAKLTFTPNDYWSFTGLIVNGWQRIQRLEGNSLPSFGTQVAYTPSEKVTLNWSTFIGTDDPDSLRRIRYFNNLYSIIEISDKFGFIVGFDFGMQQKLKNSSEFDIWYSPTFIGRYKFSDKFHTALRYELFSDNNEVIISTINQTGFMTSGASLNLDYLPNEKVICRIEGRLFNSKNEILKSYNSFTTNNFFIVSSVAVKI
jgi:hypothetical protein